MMNNESRRHQVSLSHDQSHRGQLTRSVPSSRGREAIVDKLHGALAAFRRERDDLHRSRELSQERLRLVREEREAVERTVQTMRSKLDTLNKSADDDGGPKRGGSLAELQSEVESLEKEASFQHAEMVGKRDKYNRLEARIRADTKDREASLAVARDSVRRRREMRSFLEKELESIFLPQVHDGDQSNAVDPYPQSSCVDGHFARTRDFASSQLLQEADDDLLRKLPELVEKKTVALTRKAIEMARSNDTLKRRCGCYVSYFGINAT